MSEDEKIGQLFFVRCPETDPAAAGETYQFGGYLLFGRDFENRTPDTARTFISALSASTDIKPLIGADEEGGTVVRVSYYSQYRSEKFKSPQALYNAGGLDLVLSDAAEKCEFLKDLGINVNLAPVADVTDDTDSFIYPRTLGQSAAVTADYISALVQIMDDYNMGSVLKHFPGYGGTTDSHTGTAVDSRSYEDFADNDFLPFEAGIKAGAGCILISHNTIMCMDADNPASLSAKVHSVLRDDLGFDGVIMTDDLSMGAITDLYDPGEAAVLAILAGNDILISSDYESQITAVEDAVAAGRIDMSRIDSSVLRILNWKLDLGIIS